MSPKKAPQAKKSSGAKKARESKPDKAPEPKDTRESPEVAAGVGPGPWRGRLEKMWWCVLSGVLVFTSFPFRMTPETNIWPLAWISFIPLLFVLRDVTPKAGFRYGLLMGWVTNFGGFWWISGLLEEFGHLSPWVAWPLTALNALYQGVLFGLFGWAYVKLKERRGGELHVLTIAALFTALEYLFPLIFPWYLANSQYRTLPAIQIAELVGVGGITFVIVAFNASIYRAVVSWRDKTRPRMIEVGSGVALMAATFAYGFIRLGQVDAAIEEAERLKIGLVEANIGIWEKQAKYLDDREQALTLHSNLLKHQTMSAQLQAQGVDLVVWPESSFFPLGDVFIKRTSHFAAAVTADGQLALWRDFGADEGFAWGLASETAGSLRELTAVHAAREDAIAAVGKAGRALFADASGAFKEVPTDTDADLRDVTVIRAPGVRQFKDGGPVRIWAVGDRGVLLTGDERGLARQSSKTARNLTAVAMARDGEGVAIGERGTVVTILNGEAERVEQIGAGLALHTAFVTEDESGVWVAGEQGAIWALGPSGWEREQTGTQSAIRALAGRTAGLVWAVGDAGVVLLRQGNAWRRVEGPAPVNLISATLDARGELLVGAQDGRAWRRTGKTWTAARAEGLSGLRSMTPLPYVRVMPLPKDVRYVYQSGARLPTLDEFRANPRQEFQRPLYDRTAVQRGFDAPILYGGITWEPNPSGEGPSKDRKIYNTAIMLDEIGRVVGMYDKVYLLAFGEYIPLGDWFPGLYDLIPEAGRFTAGKSVEVFPWKDKRLGVMICYEDILPAFNRRLADKDPNIIINVTNDAWFGKTSEPFLHLALSVFRSVETRLTLVRSTNTGISAVMDPTGRIISRTDLENAETVVIDVPLMDGGTLYAKIGDAFVYVLFVVLAGLWLLAGGGSGGGRRRGGNRRTGKNKKTS